MSATAVYGTQGAEQGNRIRRAGCSDYPAPRSRCPLSDSRPPVPLPAVQTESLGNKTDREHR